MAQLITTLKWTGLIGAVLLSAACDRSADPMKDYPELQSDVPQAQAKSNEQSFDGLLFDVRVQGKRGEIHVLDFYEGKETSYTILVRSFKAGLNYRLVPHGFPKGGPRLEPTQRPDTYILKWSPAKGSIPKGLTNQSFEIQLEFAIDQNSTAQARAAFEQDKRDRLTTYTVTVNFPDSEPTIKVVGLDKPEYKRGDVIDFQVEVSDINISREREPVVAITFLRSESNEAKTYPLTALFDYKKGARFEKDKWVFPYKLDTTMIGDEYFKPNSGYAAGEFLVYAVNTASRKDAQFKKRVKVIDSAPSPVVPEGGKP